MDNEPAGNYEVRRKILDTELVDDTLRTLHIDLLRRGATAEQLAEWLWSAHWFPHLNYEAPITALAEALPCDWRIGERCDPQILVQFPHVGPVPPVTFHVDQEPAWANGKQYRRIVGVPLTPWRRSNGGLLVKRGDEVEAIELAPGDAVAMTPDLPHSGGINTTGAPRYGVYFRWLD
ncbi:MAG: hypothetical protein WAL63_03725 [Solirubrobacteraceae bacterium]